MEKLKGTNERKLQDRLFLAPQPQNDAFYLFENAEGSGEGYVQLTYKKFKKPLLFTELGHDRTKPNYQNIVNGQLKHSIAYGHKHPDRLMGICHFMFTDKVWLCKEGDPPGGHCPTEGSFGVFSHTSTVLLTVNYVDTDFTHYDEEAGPCINQQLKVDKLTKNCVYDVVTDNYKPRSPKTPSSPGFPIKLPP